MIKRQELFRHRTIAFAIPKFQAEEKFLCWCGCIIKVSLRKQLQSMAVNNEW